jgi:hypothetical protein
MTPLSTAWQRLLRNLVSRFRCLPAATAKLWTGIYASKQLRKLGLSEVSVILCDEWTEAQVKAFRLMVNRSVSWAEWDEELLGLELLELKGLDFDLDLTGFNSDELDRYLAGVDATPGLTDEDTAPDPPEIPVSRSGDLWILGRHRVLCGDATKPPDIERLMAGDKG